MLKGHKVNWVGTAYNPETDRGKPQEAHIPADRRHSQGHNPERKDDAHGVDERSPLPVGGSVGKEQLLRAARFPTETISEAMEFLARALQPVKDRARWFMADQKHSLSSA